MASTLWGNSFRGTKVAPQFVFITVLLIYCPLQFETMKSGGRRIRGILGRAGLILGNGMPWHAYIYNFTASFRQTQPEKPTQKSPEKPRARAIIKKII